MKNLLVLILSIFFFIGIDLHAQDVSLPLGPFRNFLLSRYPSCFVNTNAQGQLMLNTACSAITTEDSLEFHNLVSVNFTQPVDLTGLQYFTSLVYLDCSNNQIDTYVYPPNLKYLNCSSSMADQPFGSFPTFPASLETLVCRNNAASGIPFTANLKYIDITGNYRTSLPALPAGLQTLICAGQGEPTAGRLTSLPSLPGGLIYLDCSDNEISSLPALPSSLKTLKCANNITYLNPEDYEPILTTIPALPAALEYLDCSNNKLNSLPSLPSTLKHLNCSGQRKFLGDIYVFPSQPDQLFNEGISVLPPLPAGLEYLNCSYNKLSSLPSGLPAGLTYLNCGNNVNTYSQYPVTSGITCLPHLPATLTNLVTSRTLINCYPNSGSYTSTPARPLCSPVNNIYQCVAFPVMSGRFFYDNNSNGMRDPGENYRARVEAFSGTGQYAYSGPDGYFELSGELGVNTVTAVPPVAYAAVPASSTYTFSRYDTIVSTMYALQPQVNIDSVLVSVIPITTARPGFDHWYKISYENVGTTVLSSNMKFYYDAARMTFVSGTIPGITNNGTFVTIPPIALTPGDRGSYNLTFNVIPTAILGDTIHVKAQATSNTNVAVDSVYSVIKGSFDPNDKRSTPVLSPQQVSRGAFIDYLVRFQNTGTDTAFNVVITDQLNAQLDASSFRLIDVSHPVKVNRTGSNLTFQFINIQLPDSNVNERASHGYVRFRVRPVSTVTAGSVIPNLVNIYFDFNAPVITNTANTRIEASVLPLTLLSFQATADDHKTAKLKWKTANENNTRFFDIERSLNGRLFEKTGQVQAIGQGNQEYGFSYVMDAPVEYLRLKMMDWDGLFSYSKIIRLNRQVKNESLVVLGNPAGSVLKLQVFDERLVGSTARILNAQGAVVMTLQLSFGLQNLDISRLSNGTYLLQYGEFSVKFIR